MSRTADVSTGLWHEPWFLDAPPDVKLLYLWSFTNDHLNQAGLFVVSERAIQFETGLPPKRLDAALDYLAEQRKLLFDRDTGTVWVVGKAKRVRMQTVQIVKSIVKAVTDCPSDALRDAFLTKYKATNSWLAAHLEDFALPAVSVEPHTSLTRTSPEVLGQGQGQGQQKNSNDRKSTRARDRQTVFDAWVEARGKGQPIFDAKRRRHIDQALDLYPLADVVDAVRGWRWSPHHRGENERGEVYDGLHVLLRDADQIEKFRDLERRHGGRVNGTVDRTEQRLQEASV